MSILKFILFISFVGLAVIVAKNRLKNPEMRVQFFEDIEFNKKRLERLVVHLSQKIKRVSEKSKEQIKILLPQLKRGLIYFLRDLRSFLKSVGEKASEQARAIRQDMKAFELPKHKEDFLERLGGESKTNVINLPEGTLQEEKGSDQKEVQGFQVSHLSETHFAQEQEVDPHILERKEEWLVYAIAKNPKNPTFYKKLGKIYFQMNNFEDARNCFEYALKLGAQDPEVRSFLLEVKRHMPM